MSHFAWEPLDAINDITTAGRGQYRRRIVMRVWGRSGGRRAHPPRCPGVLFGLLFMTMGPMCAVGGSGPGANPDSARYGPLAQGNAPL
jgi:hypothetical protein